MTSVLFYKHFVSLNFTLGIDSYWLFMKLLENSLINNKTEQTRLPSPIYVSIFIYPSPHQGQDTK